MCYMRCLNRPTLYNYKPYSCSFWCLLESLEVNGGPLGSQRGPRLPKVIFWSHFWLLLGAFGEHFWGHFSSEIRNGRAYVDFLVPFFRSRKKEQTRGCPGGGHAIHPRQRIFREGRPSSLRLHFGFHFGVILGAKFATILFFGRPGRQQPPPQRWILVSAFCR